MSNITTLTKLKNILFKNKYFYEHKINQIGNISKILFYWVPGLSLTNPKDSREKGTTSSLKFLLDQDFEWGEGRKWFCSQIGLPYLADEYTGGPVKSEFHVGEGEGGMFRENSMYIIYSETEHQPRWDAWDKCSGLVHWEDPEESGGEGGGRGYRDGEYM